MNEATLRRLIDDVRSGTLSADDAMAELRSLPFTELGEAVVDHHRALRQRQTEAVYAPGKSDAQCIAIVGELLSRGNAPVVVSRASTAQVAACVEAHPGAQVRDRTIVWRAAAPRPESVLVVTAGTSDLDVAVEASAVLEAYGICAAVISDVGVAGIHRITPHVPALQAADAVIVIAGMEGALASVIGGIVGCPVIAVPTSTGYGAALEGVTALLGMLASCASGVTVVGIDNGFGAACAVMRLLK